MISCCRFWQLATDALPPQDATSLAEDLGIEFDTREHTALERDVLSISQGVSGVGIKRKRT